MKAALSSVAAKSGVVALDVGLYLRDSAHPFFAEISRDEFRRLRANRSKTIVDGVDVSCTETQKGERLGFPGAVNAGAIKQRPMCRPPSFGRGTKGGRELRWCMPIGRGNDRELRLSFPPEAVAEKVPTQRIVKSKVTAAVTRTAKTVQERSN